MKKYVYSFGNGTADGDGKMKDMLGGKGAGLAEMCRAKLPVPPGFTISTEVCNIYFQNKNAVPAEIHEQMLEALHTLEERMGQKLGDAANPLLVSVRSGAKFSMPGMMDTILNLGLNDETVKALEAKSSNPRFAYDCYRRFIQMYGNVVLEIDKHDFDEVFDGQKKKAKAKLDTDLTAEDLQEVIAGYKKLVQKKTGKPFPQDAIEQLAWRARRRVPLLVQRPRQALPQDEPDSRRPGHRRQRAGHGVRQPGRDFGHRRGLHAQPRHRREGFLRRVPGERAGRRRGGRHPHAAPHLASSKPGMPRSTTSSAKSPPCWRSTTATCRISNSPSRTASCTCCRPATASAPVRRPCASRSTWWAKGSSPRRKRSCASIRSSSTSSCTRCSIRRRRRRSRKLATGLPASPGRGRGHHRVHRRRRRGSSPKKAPVILVRKETVPDDIHGMEVAKGILTSRGGMTSHAAVVCRGMGTPCVAGAEAFTVSEQQEGT